MTKHCEKFVSHSIRLDEFRDTSHAAMLRAGSSKPRYFRTSGSSLNYGGTFSLEVPFLASFAEVRYKFVSPLVTTKKITKFVSERSLLSSCNNSGGMRNLRIRDLCMRTSHPVQHSYRVQLRYGHNSVKQINSNN